MLGYITALNYQTPNKQSKYNGSLQLRNRSATNTETDCYRWSLVPDQIRDMLGG